MPNFEPERKYQYAKNEPKINRKKQTKTIQKRTKNEPQRLKQPSKRRGQYCFLLIKNLTKFEMNIKKFLIKNNHLFDVYCIFFN